MMTNGEFIKSQLRAYGITESDIVLTLEDVNPDDELDVAASEKALIPLLEKCALAPNLKSVSENGFSLTWDMGRIGWWYCYLCRKYGIKPDPDVMAALGLSVIKDATKKW